MTATDELAELVDYHLRLGYETSEAIRLAHRELYGAPQEGRREKESGDECRSTESN
jgi:hypothetical protein